MPESARRWLCAGTAVVALASVVLAPAVLAQTGEPTYTERQQRFWSQSEIHEPFEDFETVVTDSTIDFRGTFHLVREFPSDHIELVSVALSDDPADDFVPAEGCTTPEPRVFPPTDERDAGDDDQRPFEILDATFPCNGRYLISAVGRANRPDIPEYEQLRAVVVAERPAPVTQVDATLGDAGDNDDTPEQADPVDEAPVDPVPDEEGGTPGEAEPSDREERVTVTFTPFPPEQRPFDLEGYRVERAGPATASGEYGLFAPVGDDVAVDDEPEVVDVLPSPGTYRYRVRAVRAGSRQQVLSSPTASPTVDVRSGDRSETADPSTPDSEGTTVTRRSSTESRTPARIPTRRSAGPVRVPTTADTGFDEELDYGDRPAVGPAFDGSADEEFGAGQSIVREEGGEGVDFIAPVAGALVLIGWAGHIAYLNRLAKHL